MDKLSKMISIRNWLLDEADNMRDKIDEEMKRAAKYQEGERVEYRREKDSLQFFTGEVLSSEVYLLDDNVTFELFYRIQDRQSIKVSVVGRIRETQRIDEVSESQILGVTK